MIKFRFLTSDLFMKTRDLARLAAVTCLLIPTLTFAQNDEPILSFKLTPSYYKISDGNNAADLNLRAEYGAHYAWLGYYRDRAGFEQTRTGYEYHADFGTVHAISSAQVASRGFLGGSITTEIGGDTYAIIGWGRTNLRDYYNLNFDPNDAVTLGLGTRAIQNTELSLYTIKDDRLGTGQRVTHLLVRRELAGQRRVTLDFTYKSGQSTADNYVVGSGLAATYDFEPWFVRIAYDPYVNFTENRMMLLALGRRF
jgi:hypothetical protein